MLPGYSDTDTVIHRYGDFPNSRIRGYISIYISDVKNIYKLIPPTHVTFLKYGCI
jgi:hypothetical protein